MQNIFRCKLDLQETRRPEDIPGVVDISHTVSLEAFRPRRQHPQEDLQKTMSGSRIRGTEKQPRQLQSSWNKINGCSSWSFFGDNIVLPLFIFSILSKADVLCSKIPTRIEHAM